MNRRDLLKTTALAAATATRGVRASTGPAKFESEIMRINLRHTWTTTMSSSSYRDTIYTRYTRDGITGHGEGAPIVRYNESAESGRKAVESVRDLLLSADPWQFEKIMAQVFEQIHGEYAGKAAIDIALMDWVGQKLGVPIYRYFGLDPKDTPVTTFSIGIDTPEVTRQKVKEAAAFPVLKVKVGLDSDEATIDAIRSVDRQTDPRGCERGLERQRSRGAEDRLAFEKGRRVRGAAHGCGPARRHALDQTALRSAFDGG